ncbi:MAG: dTDP-glucose 4,6-dehydratase [Betaproteobacteria bacterium]
MTILVTGCAGFIGSNFVHAWLESTTENIVNVDKLTYAGNLSNLESALNDPRHIFVHADMADREVMDRLLSIHRPRAVINFAAESHVDRSIHAPIDFIQTNVLGTYHVLEAVRQYWMQLDESNGASDTNTKSNFRYIQISTDEVFGTLDPDELGFNESHLFEPNSPYSASKASSDHLVRAWHHTYGLPVLTTHCSNNYGPYHFPEKLIPLVIHNALSGKALPIYGDGLQVRDWLYVKDHCLAIMRVLEKGQVGETYNIGGCNEKTNLEVVKTICQSLDQLRPLKDKSYSEQITFVKDRPGHDRRYAIDANKIISQLGWTPLESFETGIQKTIEWYLAHPEWVSAITSGSYRDWVHQQYA